MKFGIVVFPGSNCDQDVIYALRNVMKQKTIVLWHKQETIEGFNENDWIILPGGFAYGDYLRAGAIARFSPIMKEVVAFAGNGGNVMGICNGFQILCEAGLLPGTLMRNNNQKFICKNVFIKALTGNSQLTHKIPPGKVLKIPIAHAEGNYYAHEQTLKEMKDNDQVLFQYCSKYGNTDQDSNPNGSLFDIAGICNGKRNVFGMMPHPERATDPILANTDGQWLFNSIISKVNNAVIG